MPPGQRRAHGPVDWASIRERMEAAGRAVGGRAAASREESRAVLEARARELARPHAAPRGEESLEVVTFTLAGETYAVESRFVVEVCRISEFTVVPGVEAAVAGAMAWRGELLTLFHLRRLLGLPEAPSAGLVRAVVLGEGRPAFGILVESVGEVLRIPRSEVRKLPETGGTARDHLLGITGEAVLVLGAVALLRTHG
ncbi:MAG TPA: chemotaxis protein CheW [Longimicrobiaceae bacterium]|nr:chemotaxis protein CheW [Longimicrobiaceae bacterium]